MESSPALSRTHEPQEPRGHSEPQPHHPINYIAIFILLICLTVVTVAIAFKRFESELVNVCLALLVASIKGLFVARFFMHLKFEGRLIRLILAVPIFLCVVLIAALIPDIGRGRTRAFNDEVANFEQSMPPRPIGVENVQPK